MTTADFWAACHDAGLLALCQDEFDAALIGFLEEKGLLEAALEHLKRKLIKDKTNA